MVIPLNLLCMVTSELINLRRAQGPQMSTPRDQGRAARAFYPRLGCCELLHLLNSLGHVRASLISVGLDYKGQDVRRQESLGGATVGTGYSSLLFNVKRQTDFLMQMKSTQDVAPLCQKASVVIPPERKGQETCFLCSFQPLRCLYSMEY